MAWLTNLQKKPEEAKRKLAFLGALAVTFIIFLVWLASFSIRLGTEEKEAPSPSQLLSAQVKSAWQEIKDGFKVIKESFQ